MRPIVRPPTPSSPGGSLEAVGNDTPTSGTRSCRLRACLSGLLAVLLLTAVGCGTSDLRYSPSVGVNHLGEEMDALGLTIVTNGEGVATLVGTLLNHGTQPDQLVAVQARSPNQPPITAQLTRGPVRLPVEGPIRMAESSAVTLTAEGFRLGYTVDLRLEFAHADDISL